jgi:outer membrane protein assembly factor BamA
MWQRGYADAIVDTAVSVNDSSRRAAVALRVFPNWPTTVGSIQVLGNQRVATQTVLNMLLLRPGHPFNRDDVLESQRTLYSSSLFRLASILPPTGDSIKHIEIQVVEAPLHDARIGAGFDNVNFARVEAGYSAHNLLGGARRLDITGSLANLFANNSIFSNKMEDVVNVFGSRNIFLQPTWGASVDFLQPSFMRRPENQAGFGVFAHRRAEAGIFIDRGYGATATFTRQLTARAPASLTYRQLRRLRYDDDFGVAQPSDPVATFVHGIRRSQRSTVHADEGLRRSYRSAERNTLHPFRLSLQSRAGRCRGVLASESASGSASESPSTRCRARHDERQRGYRAASSHALLRRRCDVCARLR